MTSGRRVAAVVEAFNKRLVPHAFGPAINYATSLHLAAASPFCSLIEFCVLGDVDDPGAFIASPYAANQSNLSVGEDGTNWPPEKPGLGIELDESVVEEYRVPVEDL